MVSVQKRFDTIILNQIDKLICFYGFPVDPDPINPSPSRSGLKLKVSILKKM